jgi:hypothetical protein
VAIVEFEITVNGEWLTGTAKWDVLKLYLDDKSNMYCLLPEVTERHIKPLIYNRECEHLLWHNMVTALGNSQVETWTYVRKYGPWAQQCSPTQFTTNTRSYCSFPTFIFPSMLQLFFILFGTRFEVLTMVRINNAVWVRTSYSLVHDYAIMEHSKCIITGHQKMSAVGPNQILYAHQSECTVP